MEEKQDFERNLLTKGLLAAGYTVEDHPDYVEVQHYCGTGKSLDNFAGGFTFGRQWIWGQTFKTPCGLLCNAQQGQLCNVQQGQLCMEMEKSEREQTVQISLSDLEGEGA